MSKIRETDRLQCNLFILKMLSAFSAFTLLIYSGMGKLNRDKIRIATFSMCTKQLLKCINVLRIKMKQKKAQSDPFKQTQYNVTSS